MCAFERSEKGMEFIMEKNYYEILEVDKKASPELIKKSYNILAKKYHPDLHETSQKQTAEEKFKLINQAYEILSNEEKRKQYDFELYQEEIANNKFTDELLNENISLKNELRNLKQNSDSISQNYIKPNMQIDTEYSYNEQIKYQQELQKAREKAYYDAYIQDLKNRGYKIKYKKTPKDYLNSFISLICTFIILFLLWQIPFIKNIFFNMYYENLVVQYIVDLFINLFQ